MRCYLFISFILFINP